MATRSVAAAPHQALYRRWRSQTFGEIVGQAPVVTTLRNAVRLDRLAHAFLFVGPRGTGKTSMARILAKAVNCPALEDGEPCDRCPSCTAIREGRALDVVELDAASNNRVDDMRELLPRVYTAPADLRRKVFIIDEVQRIKEGWDVLLKTLEEPPDGVFFIFCTTDPSQIRPSVISRLQRFTFRPLAGAEIRNKLDRILAEEGRTAEPAALELIAHLAAGGMRDAESMLDQVLGVAAAPVTASSVRDLLGIADRDEVERFVRALATSDALTGISVLDSLEADGRDLVSFAEQVVTALREQLVQALAAGAGAGRQGPPAAALAGAARRLSGIDASRAGLGGYRWQLELALFSGATSANDHAPGLDSATPRPGTVQDDPVTGSLPPPEATAKPNEATATTSEATATPPAISRDRTAVPRASESEELLARLRDGWQEVVDYVARNPANRPLISACRPVEMQDGVVVLGFPEDQAFLRDIAERKRRVLEEGLQHVLRRPVGVRCVATNVALPTPVATEATDLVEHARRIFQDDLADVREIS